MIKKIILVRHGETTADKNNPNRGLTKLGQKQIKGVADKLVKYLDNQKVKIVACNTVRAKMSAKIIAKKINQGLTVSRLNLRVKNIEKLKRFSVRSGLDLTSTYWQLFKENRLPSKVEKPKKIVYKFYKVIRKYQKWTILIIVGHAGALETFAKFQDQYKSKKKIKKELNYSQFIILDRKRSK